MAVAIFERWEVGSGIIVSELEVDGAKDGAACRANPEGGHAGVKRNKMNDWTQGRVAGESVE